MRQIFPLKSYQFAVTPRPRCNICQGIFPYRNDKTNGYAGPSPVTAFPPNGYGLYDMAGNVWQWCEDWYAVSAYRSEEQASGGNTVVDPQGPDKSFDPNDPYTPKRVTRGGSFLCSAAYCASYRVSARRGTSPDTSLSHTGFRCVVSGSGGRSDRIAHPPIASLGPASSSLIEGPWKPPHRRHESDRRHL